MEPLTGELVKQGKSFPLSLPAQLKCLDFAAPPDPTHPSTALLLCLNSPLGPTGTSGSLYLCPVLPVAGSFVPGSPPAVLVRHNPSTPANVAATTAPAPVRCLDFAARARADPSEHSLSAVPVRSALAGWDRCLLFGRWAVAPC